MPETDTAGGLPPALNPRGPGSSPGKKRTPNHHAAPGGLSGAAALVLLLVVTLGFAVGTALTGHAFGRVYEGAFVVVTLYVALRVRLTDRFVAMVAPPLVYVLGVGVSALLDSEAVVHDLRTVATRSAQEVSLGAPYLVTASVLAVVICLVRGSLANRRASSSR